MLNNVLQILTATYRKRRPNKLKYLSDTGKKF